MQKPIWIIAHCLSVNGDYQDHYRRFEGNEARSRACCTKSFTGIGALIAS